MSRIAIVGPGRVGTALHRALAETDCPVDAIYGRTEHPGVQSLANASAMESEILILAVPDAEIPSVVEVLSSKRLNGPVVLHASGPLSSEVLAPLRTHGCAVGSMHPLVSLNGENNEENPFRGAYFGVEGDDPAVSAGKFIAARLEAEVLIVPSGLKSLYHAAAVAACGHVTALFDLAVAMMRSSGVQGSLCEVALLPLVKSTIRNIEENGTAHALTGTFARGDAAGLSRQLGAFEGVLTDEERDIYLTLGSRSLDIASQNGAPIEAVEEMRELIFIAKQKGQ